MTKVYSADLTNANSSAMTSQLQETSNSSAKILAQLNSFIGGSKSVLTGDGYDAVRAKFSVYADAVSKQKQICDNLLNNVKAANNIMIAFMEGYSYLDDSLIPDIEASIADVRSFIAYLESYDEEKKSTIGSAAEIAHWKAILADLEKKLAKLKQLAPTDASSFALLDDVSADMMNFAQAIYELKLPQYD